MTQRTVKDQASLDQALTDGIDTIYIKSDPGVWLYVNSNGPRGSSSVVARGSSSVEARGSSRVEAWGSSRVVAWESSSVVAWESSSVVAGKYTAVHLHSARVTLDAQGAVIDLTELDLSDPAIWLDYTGIKVSDGKAVVYKAVDAQFVAGQGYKPTPYPIGEVVIAPDWQATPSCGCGLHFSASPSGARSYYGGSGEARFLACEIDVAAMVPLNDKVKASSCRVLYEVDIHGDRIGDG